jgi:uncharacterized protein (DUF488 family)
MKQLATLGYEGASQADFIATLRKAGVTVVVDVRELPLSRRKGFSKTALAKGLASADIKYRHFRDLGDPKPGREAARAGHFADFKRIYLRHIKTAAAQIALAELLEIVVGNNACLLCYERDPNHCHRTIVANELADRSGVGVVHLGVRAGAAENDKPKVRRRTSGSLSQSAAATQ